MKLIFTILLFISSYASATVYYVSNTGSDAANGTTTGTAWATIAKVNSFSFNPGDQILFNKGDSWSERLNFPSSGTIGNVITIGAYGTGVKPLITGLQTQTGFTNVGNVWTSTATNAVKQLNTVLISGSLKAKARTPNTGWSTFSAYSGNTQITTGLTGTPNYTGSEVVIRSAHWVIDKTIITSQSSGVLNFSPAITYTPSLGGNGYFIQNNASDLDIAGEWAFDSTTKILKVYSATSPIVQISTIDTLVWLRSKSYITFDGISFTGANKAAFQLDTANHITIQNCNINYSGTLGVSAKKSIACTVKKDSIQNSLSGAIYLRQVDPYTPTVNVCDSALVDSCYIKNTAIYAGMGMNSNGRYVGIFIVGLNTTITNNKIDSTGFNSINFNGQNSLIKNNFITNFCFVKDDGAGIDCVIGTYFPANYNDGSIVRGNIILNGLSAPAGTSTDAPAGGIYLDNACRFITVDSNTVYNAYFGGIVFNGTNNITLRHNTVVDSIGPGLAIYYGNPTTALSIKRNIFYSPSSLQPNIYFQNSDVTQSVDSNYYLRPVLETGKLKMVSTLFSLPAWVAAKGYDVHSTETPTGITAALPLFHYNPTLNDSVISLNGTFKDAKSVSYTNSITLARFSSALLFWGIPVFYNSIPRRAFIGSKTNYTLRSL